MERPQREAALGAISSSACRGGPSLGKGCQQCPLLGEALTHRRAGGGAEAQQRQPVPHRGPRVLVDGVARPRRLPLEPLPRRPDGLRRRAVSPLGLSARGRAIARSTLQQPPVLPRDGRGHGPKPALYPVRRIRAAPCRPPTPPGAAVVGALGAVTVVGAREAMAPRPRQARVPGEKRLHLRAPPVLAPPPP